MSDESTGAVEIAVVEFPGSKFKGEIVPRCPTWSRTAS